VALLGAAFQIGRSALAAYQAAISIAGQNVANVGNPDYARQTGRLAAQVGGPTLGGVRPGGGVRLTELRRHVDEALENRLRLAAAGRSAGEALHRTLAQVESLYNELSDQDISTQLSGLLAGFAQLQTAPQDSSARRLVLSAAESLISSLRRQRDGLIRHARDLNDEAIAATRRVNELAGEIARLNASVVAEEADGVTVASALRDRRDALLRDLSDLLDVQVREQENGAISVYLGSRPLIEFDRARLLTTETTLEDGLELWQVRFVDDGAIASVRSGRLAGILQARDQHIVGQLQRLDRLARGLIYEVNRIHSTGVGMVGYTQITSDQAVADPEAALNAAGLIFPVSNGTLLVKVRDTATRQVITRQVAVNLDGLNGDDTTLAGLAAALNAVPGLSASVTADNRLSLSAEAGREFWFNEDSSGVLAALGLAGFFTGSDAATIDVDPLIRQDVRRLATSLEGAVNDGTIAGRIAGLQSSTATSTLLDGQSIQDFHTATIAMLAVEAARAAGDFEAADTVYNGLYAQREAISGVSLDEEAINLTKFERAFQGAARYVSVLESMTSELLALLR